MQDALAEKPVAEEPKELSPNEKWEREFPKTYDEALDRVNKTRAAYKDLEIPEGPFPDTPSRPLSIILLERDQLLWQNRNPENYGGFYNSFSHIDVPPGFEEWALEKQKLANLLYQAKAAKNIFEERQGKKEFQERLSITEVPEGLKIEEKDYDRARAEHEEEQREMDEISAVMMGEFRVDIIDGKPKMAITSPQGLSREAWREIRNKHNEWIKKHEGKLLSKFPRLSNLLELISNSIDFLRMPPNLLVELFLARYVEYYMNEYKKAKSALQPRKEEIRP